MKKAIKFLVLTLVCVFSTQSWAGTQDDYKFHGMFLLNFVKYIQWPNPSGEFVIGVLGDNSIMADLERASVGRRTSDGRSIVVKRFSSSERLTDCQMLYVSEPQSKDLNDVVMRLGDKALIISVKDGLIRKGSAINFVIREGKWRFEINEKAAEKAKVKIGVELSRLAV